MKKIAIILFFLFWTVALISSTGCHKYQEGFEYSNTENIFRKQDTFINSGQYTACNNGRIYYVSQENGDDGISSMNFDGSDVKFELSVPKISDLIVTKDNIFYIGIDHVEKGEKYFSLFQFDRTNHKITKISYTEDPESVYDAYVTENGAIFVLAPLNLTSSAGSTNYSFVINNSEEFKIKKILSDGNNDLYYGKNSEVFLMVLNNNYSSNKLNAISSHSASFVDITNGTAFMDDLWIKDEPYFKALCTHDNKGWFSIEDVLYELDLESMQINFIYTKNHMSQEDIMYNAKITEMCFSGDNAYIIFKEDTNETEHLYALNLDKSAYSKLGDFSTDKALLNIANGQILWAEGYVIHCDAIDVGEYYSRIGESVFEIKMPENIISNNILETAGDWLFIYQKDEKTSTSPNKLLYKVNLITKEIVDIR